MGLPGWQPPCLRVRAALFAHASRATRELWLRKSERKVCPSTLRPPSLFPRALLVRGSFAAPRRRQPLGSLKPQVPFRHRMSSLRGVSFLSFYLPPVLPGARRPGIPVLPPPSPRCIADESIPADILTHWRSMPRSRERRRPQPPTFPTLQPSSRSQTRALGRVGRRLPPLTRPLSSPIVQARQRDETTTNTMTTVEC
ncbi:hypothetical protein PUN28_010277 [Cardiocondyla obscurior]|uniref:Uncharacterized protein n=1 Tax=Cardiocondyla obscurior TaxID=286306 RepID=A0AAW2FQA2_9HYME